MDIANFEDNIISFGFHYYNYEFIQNTTNLHFPLFYACLYDHLSIVELLINSEKVDINQSIILKINIY